MALRQARYVLLVVVTLFLLVTPSAIYSCGPFLESAIFSFRDQPDGPAENFAAGTLGIVRPGFRTSYLVIAYRYLSGLSLALPQQQAAVAVWNRDVVPEHPGEEDSAASWQKARDQVPDLPDSPKISPFAPVSPDQPYFQYVNCPGEAFLTAVKTLDDRKAKFGLKNAELREWVTAQDQVFVNCSGETHFIPAELPTGDTLARADRAYQIASANFYARSLDDAVREFDAIAKDSSSPWARISPYLAARALIRKATLLHKENDRFDAVAMKAAQERLEQIVNDPKARSIHDAAEKLLNFVKFRTEPAKRVAELEQAILRPDPGPSFKQDLWDYVLLLSQGEQAGDLSDWLKTFSSLAENAATGDQREEAMKHALDKWRKTKAVPWLIATLKGTEPASPELAPLLADARRVPASSRGYLSAQYYALSLMVGSGQPEGARKELDGLLARIGSETPADSLTPLGSYNLLNDLRLRLTTSLDDFLKHAAERPVGADEGEGTDSETQPGSIKIDEKYFTPYSAKIFQKRLPLPLLVESAQSGDLSKLLRRDVARSTWTRAVLLDDLKAATDLQATLQELDPPLWKTMEAFRTASDDAAKKFAGIFIILQNPGLKPVAREGSPRSATLGDIDNYRDNWWCSGLYGGANWGDRSADPNVTSQVAAQDDVLFPFPPWVSAGQKTAAQSQWQTLNAIGFAPNYLTKQVLDRAKAEPQDPRVPQALYLAVRATHYGCGNTETTPLSKAAFEVLHKKYAESEWAAKTKYYY
jgi:hypothetical protein